MMTHRHPITRRTLMRGAAATAAFGLTPALAQNAGNWPDHAVRMVIPYPAGGSTDVLFRILAERLKDKLGQSFVIENKPGASGNIGIDQIAKGAAGRLRHRRRHGRAFLDQPVPDRQDAVRRREGPRRAVAGL